MSKALLNAEQQSIYDSMSAAWKKKANRALEIREERHRANVWGNYELGEIVRAMTGSSDDEEEKTDKPKRKSKEVSKTKTKSTYGNHAVEALAVVMGEDSGQLWLCRKFATTYTRELLQKLIDRSLETGRPIAWSHLRLLSAFDTPGAAKVRRELESATINNMLTADELKMLIRKQRGSISPNSGRKLSLPRTPMSGIGQMTKLSLQFSKRYDETWAEGVFERLDKAGEDEIDEYVLQHLTEGYEALQQLQGRVESCSQDFTRVMNRVSSIVTRKSKSKKPVSEGKPEKPAAKKAVAKPKAAPKPVSRKRRRASSLKES